MTRSYTDGWGVYERYIVPEQHPVGEEHTQKIESKHLNLRTRIKRLVRRTVCKRRTPGRWGVGCALLPESVRRSSC
ncbi:MAG: hypothetical protein FJZ47_18390 [Candidatus Tectomicrobia bacterium]|uniref:Transposase n=1 Tax=Tectimicrobiota bacterium TaxID=2528274 RepID=A0A938B456_UNCTE|nr:hypothetical protein [Candidatus Tectomicrobia bacterium]